MSASSPTGDDNSSGEGYTWDTLKNDILYGLHQVHSSGSFASFGCHDEYVHPGLEVDDLGPIRLPVSVEDAEALIRVSRLAPFGKGNETCTDETVRKTWEIDGKRVSFSNSAWEEWLNRLLAKVSEDLGICGGSSNLRAELYKLLVYEQGSFFKPHKDTEKESNMFGTLVICLPSPHVGGCVRIRHRSEEKLLVTDQAARYAVSHLAWYADVSHEILPILSGHRIVLAYNLLDVNPQQRLSASTLDNQLASLTQPFENWYEMDDGPMYVCYTLEHQYTTHALNLSRLKGDDYYRARQLDKACSAGGRFYIFLAHLERVVTVSTGEEEMEQEELLLRDIVTTQGRKLMDTLRINEDHIVQEYLYDSREPDRQYGGEYLGNQNADIEQRYNDTAIVAVYQDHATDVLLGRHDVRRYARFLQMLQRHMEDAKCENKEFFRRMILQTCQKHIDMSYNGAKTKDTFMSSTVLAAMSINNEGLAEVAVRSVTESLDRSTFYGLGKLGLDASSEICADALIRTPKLHLVHRGLQAFRSGIADAHEPGKDKISTTIDRWTIDALCKSLQAITSVSPEDAGAIIDIFNTFDDSTLGKCVEAFVCRFLEYPGFVNALLVEYFSYFDSVQVHDRVMTELLPPVLDAAGSSFQLSIFSSASKHARSREDFPYSSWPDVSDPRQKGEKDASVVTAVYRHLVRKDLEISARFLQRIAEDAATIGREELDRMVIPLLHQMIEILELQPAEVSQFYETTISTYIRRVVQDEPVKPQDWDRRDEVQKCYTADCRYCGELRDFLEDRAEETRTFIVPNSDYHHFQWQVPNQCRKTKEKLEEEIKIQVTKTIDGWEARYKGWQERATQAQVVLRRLPEMPLRQCLGDDRYLGLMQLHIVKLQIEDTTELPSAVLQPKPEGADPTSAIPQKRKIDSDE